MNNGQNDILVVILLVVTFFVGVGVGGCTGQHSMQKEAVKRMAGRWDTDLDGNTKFEWNLEPILESNK